jgi:clan AA aspartic protease (TIGR02281 family)
MVTVANLSRFVVMLLVLCTPYFASAESIQLEEDGGTYLLPVRVNDAISLRFVLDSGASDVAVPADVARMLMGTGTVTPKDFLGTTTYILADGSKLPSPRFMLHTVRIGNHVVRNVIASIGPAEGTLLLGQSFLSKLPTWTIDNAHHALILADEPGASGAPQVATVAPAKLPENSGASTLPFTINPNPSRPPQAMQTALPPPRGAPTNRPGNVAAAPYPAHLANMLEPTDWPYVLAALTLAERSTPEESIRWTNPLNGHEGFITRSDVGQDPEGCFQYRIARRSPNPPLLDFFDVCNGQVRR